MRKVFSPKPFESLPAIHKERVSSEFPKFQAVKREILKNIPSTTEGLNLKQVENFVRSFGLPIRDYVIFNDDNMKYSKAIVEIFEKLNLDWDKETYSTEWVAMCDNELDLILVKRFSEDENLNGSNVTEALLVHELAHGSSGFSRCIITSDSKIVMPRVGFKVSSSLSDKQGAFLEEGFADLLAGKYNQTYTSSTIKEKFSGLFPRKYMGYNLTEIYSSTSDGKIVLLPFPSHQAILTDNNSDFAYRESALAAFGLELLCDKNPKLFQMLLKARTDIKYLRYIAQAIDQISPGLYVELRKLKYSNEDFSAGLYIILNKVYDRQLGNLKFPEAFTDDGEKK